MLGRNEDAGRQYEYMVEVNRATNSVAGELWALTQLHGLYCDLGKMDAVREIGKRTDELLQIGGKAHRQLVTQSGLQTKVYLGNAAEAIEDLHALRDEAVAAEEKQTVIIATGTLSLAYQMTGDYDRAALEMKFGIENAGIWAGANYQYLLAALQARSGADISVAKETLARADDMLDREPTFAEIVTRLYALMHVSAREGKFDKALESAEELDKRYKASRNRWHDALVLWEAGEIALKAGDKGKAKMLLAESQALYEEMNVPIYAARVGAQLRGIA